MSEDRSTREKQWEPMRLTELGNVGQVVREGMGKLTPPGGDPGENRKQGPAEG